MPPSQAPALGEPDVAGDPEHVNVEVECWSKLSRGRTVVDRRGRSGRKPNARVAVDVDTAAFVRLLIERLRTLG